MSNLKPINMKKKGIDIIAVGNNFALRIDGFFIGRNHCAIRPLHKDVTPNGSLLWSNTDEMRQVWSEFRVERLEALNNPVMRVGIELMPVREVFYQLLVMVLSKHKAVYAFFKALDGSDELLRLPLTAEMFYAAFIWSDTENGYDFWSEISDDFGRKFRNQFNSETI